MCSQREKFVIAGRDLYARCIKNVDIVSGDRGLEAEGRGRYFSCVFQKVFMAEALMAIRGSLYHGCEFYECDMRGIKFERANFYKCKFTNCAMDEVDFGRSIFNGVEFVGKLSSIRFRSVLWNNRPKIDFTHAALSGCMFSGNMNLSLVSSPVRQRTAVVPNAKCILAQVGVVLSEKGYEEAGEVVEILSAHPGPKGWTIIVYDDIAEWWGEDIADAVFAEIREAIDMCS